MKIEYFYNERDGSGSANPPSGQVTLRFHYDEILKILDQELPVGVDQKTLERIADKFETYMLENHMQAMVDRHDPIILKLPPRPDQSGSWGE